MLVFQIFIFFICIILLSFSMIGYGSIITRNLKTNFCIDFFFGIMVVFDQITLFSSNSESIHLAVASLWLIQTSLAIPNKLPYDRSKLAKSAGIKIYSALSIINLFGTYYATKGDEVPEGAMYGHLFLAILPLVAIFLILSDKIEITK